MPSKKVQFDINEFKNHFNYFIVDKIVGCLNEKFGDLSHEEVVNFLDKLYLLYAHSKTNNISDYDWITKIVDVIKISSSETLHRNFCYAFNLGEDFFQNSDFNNFSSLENLEKSGLVSNKNLSESDEDLFLLNFDELKSQEFFDKISSDIKKIISSEFVSDYKKLENEIKSFYETQIISIKQNSQEIIDRYKNLKKVIEDVTANFQVLSAENGQLKKDLLFANEQIKNLVDKFNEDTNNYRKDVYNLQEIISKKNNDIFQLVNLKNQIVDKMNSNLQIQSENLNKQISEKEQEMVDQYESKIGQVKKIIDDKKEIIKNLNSEISSLNRDISAIKIENKKNISQINKYSNLIKKYEKTISTLKIDKLNQSNKTKIALSNKKDLLKQISSFKGMMKRNVMLEASIEKLFKEQKNLENLLKSQKDIKEDSLLNLSKKITDVKENISSLKKDIKVQAKDGAVAKKAIVKNAGSPKKKKSTTTKTNNKIKQPVLNLTNSNREINDNISGEIVEKLFKIKKKKNVSRSSPLIKRVSKIKTKIIKSTDNNNNRSLVNIFDDSDDVDLDDYHQLANDESIKVEKAQIKNKIYKKKIIP